MVRPPGSPLGVCSRGRSFRGASPARGGVRLGCLVLVLGAVPARAYETDQFTARSYSIADSTALLNARVNRELERVAADWSGARNDRRFARAVYWRLGGPHWVDRIERWAMRSAEISKVRQRKPESIYAGAPFWTTRFVTWFGLGPTLRLGGVLIGSDKLGHFMSQGFKYYRRHDGGLDEPAVMRLGRRTEVGFFGKVTTGVFSNADLVANYEGYRFYRGLFEDGVVPGKPAIVAWRGGRPHLQRPFDFADYVTDFWDEALNPNDYGTHLEIRVLRSLVALCDIYRADPGAFTPGDEPALVERYAAIGLRPSVENRLDSVCAPSLDGAVAAGGAGRP